MQEFNQMLGGLATQMLWLSLVIIALLIPLMIYESWRNRDKTPSGKQDKSKSDDTISPIGPL